MTQADFEREMKALNEQVLQANLDLQKKREKNKQARIDLQKKSVELKAPDLLTKNKTNFEAELGVLTQEVDKMKKEWQHLLKPLKDYQSEIERKLYESNEKLKTEKEKSEKEAKSNTLPEPTHNEIREVNEIAKKYRDVSKLE